MMGPFGPSSRILPVTEVKRKRSAGGLLGEDELGRRRRAEIEGRSPGGAEKVSVTSGIGGGALSR